MREEIKTTNWLSEIGTEVVNQQKEVLESIKIFIQGKRYRGHKKL